MLLALLFTLALGIEPISQSAPYTNSVAMKGFLRERGISSESVKAIRGVAFVRDESGEADKHLPEGERLSDRPLSSEEVILPAKEVLTLVNLLHAPGTYAPDLYKLCVPHYGVGVTLVSTKGYTEFVFCLHCDSMIVTDGKNHYGINTDGAHNELLDFFRRAFPKNGALKKLSRHKAKYVLKPEAVIDWAEANIPDDPLLKRVKAMTREERSFEVLEELANKATSKMRSR